MDELGKVVFENGFNSGTHQVALSMGYLANGTYMLEVEFAIGKVKERLVIVK